MQIKILKIGPLVPIVLLIMATFFFRPGSVGGASVVRTDKDIYNQGEMIRVYFSNAPGNNRDWICIVPAGSPDTDGGDYKYMPGGLGKGSLTFDPRSPGKYEVRAYYNYSRNGYVVSGRHAFSVGSYPVKKEANKEEAFVQSNEQIDSNNSLEDSLPPPIPFIAPPNVVVLPGSDVYAVPDVEEELYFQGGWWWRPWGGHWYRSKYHDHGWAYYRDSPSWHRGIPRDWRHNYSNHIWGGRPWNPPHINHGNLNDHWSGGHWRNDHGWGRPGKPTLHGGDPGGGKPDTGPKKPTLHSGGPGGGKPDSGPNKPSLHGGGPGGGKPGTGPGKPTLHGGGPGGGKPDSGPKKPTLHGSGPGGGKPDTGPKKPILHGGDPGGATHPDERVKKSHGDASGRGDRK
jgi:hypothetical protein